MPGASSADTRRGSSASRRPSPRKLNAITVRKIAVPGTNSSHGKRRQRADAARLVQHVAPRRARLLHADAEKRQHDLAQDVAGNRQRRGHDHVRHRVRQHVPRDDAQPAESERLGRRHVLALAHRQHQAADDARQAGPADERENRDDAEVDLLARQIDREDRAQRDDQIERRDAQQQLGRPHDDRVDEAAEVAGDAAEQQPERERNRDADQARPSARSARRTAAATARRARTNRCRTDRRGPADRRRTGGRRSGSRRAARTR